MPLASQRKCLRDESVSPGAVSQAYPFCIFGDDISNLDKFEIGIGPYKQGTSDRARLWCLLPPRYRKLHIPQGWTRTVRLSTSRSSTNLWLDRFHPFPNYN